jgi:S1 RNA binding domain protein
MSDEELKGKVVEGDVTNVTNFGAFVRLENGEEGLVHISEIANEFVQDINQFVTVGDKVKVKVLGTNTKGKLELSMKQTSEKEVEKTLFIHKKTKNTGFEDKITGFLKKSEEKQIDIRRNLKNKQGITKKKK